MAPVFNRSVVLLLEWRPRTAVSIVRQLVEYVLDERPLSRLRSPVGVDVVFALPGMGPSRRLVRARLSNLRVTPVSNDLMKRALAFLVIAAALGCSSGQNTDCRWPDESPRILDLRADADASHLMQDVELAEELSVRFADESEFGPGPQRQRLRVERCYDPLVAGIMARHGVSMADVLDAQQRIGERGLNLVVNAPVAAFFGFLTLIVLRRIRRRFSGADERVAVAIASTIAAVFVAGLTTGVGRVWQMVSETIRIGNGHLGGQRGLRLPWVQHTFEYFIVASVAFLVIAVLYHRRAAAIPAASRNNAIMTGS